MTTVKHRNKAVMTAEEFTQKCKELLGNRQSVWRKRMVDITGFSHSTISRMASGAIPVTAIVSSLLYALEIMAYNDRIDYVAEFGLED